MSIVIRDHLCREIRAVGYFCLLDMDYHIRLMVFYY